MRGGGGGQGSGQPQATPAGLGSGRRVRAGADARRALDFEFASAMYDQADDFSMLQFYKISDGQRTGVPFDLGKREAFLNGELDPMIDALTAADTAEKLKNSEF